MFTFFLGLGMSASLLVAPEAPLPVRVVADIPQVIEVDKTNCSCILTARKYGVAIPYGTNAGDLEPNSPPSVGGLVLLEYDGVGHVAVVTELGSDTFSIREGNYERCRETRRELSYDDENIRGFWTP